MSDKELFMFISGVNFGLILGLVIKIGWVIKKAMDRL